jgi:hypothetical protein
MKHEQLRTAAYSDAKTRQYIRDTLLPKWKQELRELQQCEADCSHDPKLLQIWREAGMNELASAIRVSIEYAERQVAAH